MALNLYLRHRKECEAGHVEDARTGEVEERRRGWKKCAWLIHASGTLAGQFIRRQTGKFTWDEAKAVCPSLGRAHGTASSSPHQLRQLRFPAASQ